MDILGGVGGSYGEIILFVVWFVVEVVFFFFLISFLMFFDIVGKVVVGVFCLVKVNIIEEEKFGFGVKVNGVGNVGVVEIFSGFGCNGVGVMVILFFGVGFFDVVNYG